MHWPVFTHATAARLDLWQMHYQQQKYTKPCQWTRLRIALFLCRKPWDLDRTRGSKSPGELPRRLFLVMSSMQRVLGYIFSSPQLQTPFAVRLKRTQVLTGHSGEATECSTEEALGVGGIEDNVFIFPVIYLHLWSPDTRIPRQCFCRDPQQGGWDGLRHFLGSRQASTMVRSKDPLLTARWCLIPLLLYSSFLLQRFSTWAEPENTSEGWLLWLCWQLTLAFFCNVHY